MGTPEFVGEATASIVKPSNFNRPAFPNIQVRVTPLTEKKGKNSSRKKTIEHTEVPPKDHKPRPGKKKKA